LLTHERNVLMWLAGKLYKIRWPRFAFWVSMVILYSILGCQNYRNSTGPSEFNIAAIVMNECNKLSITAVIRYSDEVRLIDGTPYGRPGETLTAAMWAAISKNEVVIWSRLAEDPERYDRDLLFAFARHECCHLKMGYGDYSINVEDLANQCVVDNWEDPRLLF